MSTNLLRVLSACVLVAAPSADEVRTRDGRTFVGEVVRRDVVIVVKTRDGDVELAASDVERIRTTAELRAELKRTAAAAGDDAFAHLQLARTAFDWGLSKEMWGELDAVIARLVGEPNPSVERMLRRFLPTLESELLPLAKRQRPTPVRVRALLRQVRSSTPPARRAAIVAVLTNEQDADKTLQSVAKLGVLPEERVAAIETLRARGTVPASFVYGRALMDRDDAVRTRLAHTVRDAGESEAAVKWLAPGLIHDAPAIRIRTAMAYAAMGDRSAIPVLAAAGPFAGTPKAEILAGNGNVGVRAHMMSVTQQAYIKDFDVEIAQAAAVANPQIGTVSRGVVLDVTVAAVVSMRVPIRNAYRRALAQLGGSDPGDDPAGWSAWAARLPELDADRTDDGQGATSRR